jgi:hypothetical protein
MRNASPVAANRFMGPLPASGWGATLPGALRILGTPCHAVWVLKIRTKKWLLSVKGALTYSFVNWTSNKVVKCVFNFPYP